MKRFGVIAASLYLGVAVASAQRAGSGVTLFQGARIITGDSAAPIENGAFLVENGRLTKVGKSSDIPLPAGSQRVDLTGKTVIPALNNVHIHIGYEGYTSWSAKNLTTENVLDHLEREAFYGTGAVLTMGDVPEDFAFQFQKDQAAGKYPPAARFFFTAGIAPPGGGPDVVLIQATTPLHVVHEVSTPAEARAAVQQIAAKKISQIKIWVDERDNTRGSKKKMSPEVYSAVIDEAHKHGILVHAHATNLTDQKGVVRAGVDVLVHTVTNVKIDDEFIAILKEKKPYWVPVMGLGDRSELCAGAVPFIEQVLPEKTVDDIREGRNGLGIPGCKVPQDPARQANLEYNFPKMVESGARVVLSTDAGVIPKYSYGWAEHHEMEMYVKLGLTPAQAIVASTSRPTEVLRINDTGVLTAGKRADFVVLNANPLDGIRNTRQINSVYLNGVKVDRDRLLAGWAKTRSSQ